MWRSGAAGPTPWTREHVDAEGLVHENRPGLGARVDFTPASSRPAAPSTVEVVGNDRRKGCLPRTDPRITALDPTPRLLQRTRTGRGPTTLVAPRGNVIRWSYPDLGTFTLAGEAAA